MSLRIEGKPQFTYIVILRFVSLLRMWLDGGFYAREGQLLVLISIALEDLIVRVLHHTVSILKQ